MKANLLLLPLVLLLANHSFAQTPQKSQMAKKKDSVPPILYEKTVVASPKLVPASAVNPKPQTETTVTPNPNLVNASIVNAKPKTDILLTKNPNLVPAKPVAVPPPAPNVLNAKLLDAFVTASTGYAAVGLIAHSGYNKDPDTHWSCGIFDQNGRPVTSFHDDSDNDEYPEGSVTGPLQMHIDNSAVLGDFATNGHIHINIAPNGNDTWQISSFTLALDFQNPSLSQKLAWSMITLSQDKRDIDLYFLYDGKNLVVRQ
jgi:hypothetical protein